MGGRKGLGYGGLCGKGVLDILESVELFGGKAIENANTLIESGCDECVD